MTTNMKTLDALIKRMNNNQLDIIEYAGIKIVKSKHYYLNDIDLKPKRELDPNDPEYERTLYYSSDPDSASDD